MQAEHFHQVFDWLWTSGQPSADDIAAMPAMGIRHVINLALPSASNALPGEAELITAQGISYLHIPVPWEQPALHHLHFFCTILKALEGQPTWVHCARNMRVSSFIYLYRRLRGDSEADARQLLDQVWVPNPVWAALIAEALAKGAAQG